MVDRSIDPYVLIIGQSSNLIEERLVMMQCRTVDLDAQVRSVVESVTVRKSNTRNCLSSTSWPLSPPAQVEQQ
jgi:hypothetical protein